MQRLVTRYYYDEMGGACRANGETRNAYKILVGKPEGKRSLETPGHK
jgi:hypothetical protein